MTLPAAAQVIADAAGLGVVLSLRQAERLLGFAALLLRWNRSFNLISRQDQNRLYERHLLDSLCLAPWLEGGPVLDLGTGAGLPGIPLAIAREDLQFLLADRNARRIRFVERAVRELAIGNARARCVDAAQIDEPGAFGCVVSRAVTDLATLWRLAAPLLAARGVLLVLHSVQQAVREDAARLGDSVTAEIREVEVPGRGVQRIVRISRRQELE
ncbi:MAG: 16S rRNA (guanine(527)-N(7))-methyltransferase RsmG [Pseudomonadales bacterium]